MKQETKKQNIAQDMVIIANLKGLRLEAINFFHILKRANYTKKEAIKYMPCYTRVIGLSDMKDLFIYWIKKNWGKI